MLSLDDAVAWCVEVHPGVSFFEVYGNERVRVSVAGFPSIERDTLPDAVVAMQETIDRCKSNQMRRLQEERNAGND